MSKEYIVTIKEQIIKLKYKDRLINDIYNAINFIKGCVKFKVYNQDILRFMTPRLQDVEYIVRCAIEAVGGNCIQYASDRLKNREELVLYALSTCGSDYCMEYVSKKLKNDSEFMIKAMHLSIDAVFHISKHLEDDDNFISKLIEINNDYFFGIERASDRIKRYGTHGYGIGFGYNYETIKKDMWKEGGIAQGLAEYHGNPMRIM
jgi:hypothetical protein